MLSLEGADCRVDPLSKAMVVVASRRQNRPNLPSADCPFCPGGLEAPEDYDGAVVQEPMATAAHDRCEIVLFSADHSQSLASLEPRQLGRVISIWTERSEALGSRPDVGYVLVFENRGTSVGATITIRTARSIPLPRCHPCPWCELRTSRCAICDELGGRGAGARPIPAGSWRRGKVGRHGRFGRLLTLSSCL